MGEHLTRGLVILNVLGRNIGRAVNARLNHWQDAKAVKGVDRHPAFAGRIGTVLLETC